ncbi:MAG: ABC transporter permease, partial [Bryobacteraceae bacterium]|nr:ABC transporter permease [Bryobacteraceae bacterium]
MQMFEQLKALVRNVTGKTRVEQDLDEEVRAYLDMTIDEKVSRGMSRDKALREARIELGGVEQLKEEVRAVKLGASLEKTWRDFRFALRLFARNPGFTAVIVLSLGLCIGANTAIFSLVNALLLKTLPVKEPERLVLYSDGRARGFISGQSGRWNIFSYPLYQRFREPGTSFEDVAAFRTQLDRLSLRAHGTGSGEGAQLAWGRLVSGNYFPVLGVKAALGRSLTADDERLAAVPVAVLAFDYWKRQYESSPTVVGQVIDINGVPVTIVGVAPAEFFGESVESQLADVWLPLTLQPRIMQRQSALEDAEANWLNLIGRLRPGITMVQAQAEVSARFQQFLIELAGANLTREQQQQLQRNHVVLIPGANGISALR